MASPRKSKSFGLRYVWIPGRKRSHPKGRFSSTNKIIKYNTVHKKSEPWSLGGSKIQKAILITELDTDSGTSISSSGSAQTVIAAPAMPALIDTKQNKFAILDNGGDLSDLPVPPKDGAQYETPDLIENSVGSQDLRKPEMNFDGDLPSVPSEDEKTSNDVKDTSAHDKKTWTASQKRSHVNNMEPDINSIQSINENKRWDPELNLPDVPDYGNTMTSSYQKKGKKKKKRNKNTSDDEEDELTVKCLYYTLMCCECTIS